MADTQNTELEQLHVLVIDDDSEVRELLTRIVLRAGHQVVPADTAEAGLELLPYYTFQVALLDQHLPGMEGLVLGEYLRKNNPNMKIALVTGEPTDQLVRFGRDHDISVIPKPFEVTQILDLMTAYEKEERARVRSAEAPEAEDYAPRFSRFARDLPEVYEIPNLPKRIEERIVHIVKQSLNALRGNARHEERERVVALSGLVALQVLGIKPPKASSGRTLFEEYDALMRERHQRQEFGPELGQEAGDEDREEPRDDR